MRTTIDKAGRIVIPRELREIVGLVPGEVDVVVEGTAIVIKPRADNQPVKRDGRWVVPTHGKRFTADDIDRIRRADQR